ncbi:unnamed protein product [Meganyctiphanes norvegica]|uniref:Uncharacterized protein n=1 Tax=Meganyctiphanes norvegica TaxID=48144 RepID=A0AAV2RWQ1_MEGNR
MTHCITDMEEELASPATFYGCLKIIEWLREMHMSVVDDIDPPSNLRGLLNKILAAAEHIFFSAIDTGYLVSPANIESMRSHHHNFALWNFIAVLSANIIVDHCKAKTIPNI